MVASIKVGSLKLKGTGVPRARSRARQTTGHGARGRTERARSQWRAVGGGGRCGAPGAAHSRGLPTASGFSAAQTGPRRLPTAEGGLQTHMHFAEGCLFNPASCPASLATLRTQGLPRGHVEETKGQSGCRSRQGYPLVTTPAEEIQGTK